MKKILGQNLIVILIALLVNGLLFMCIPFLSQVEEKEESKDYLGSAVDVQYIMRKTKESLKPTQDKDISKPKPKRLPEKELHWDKQVIKKRPDIAYKIPDFQVQLDNLSLSSVQIDAPPPAEAVPHADPLEGSHGPFNMQEVDRQPRVISKIEPIYPYRARQRDITGKVVLKFLIDQKGRPKKISVLKAEPDGVFEKSAISAVEKWKFEPGYYQGHPVATWVTLPIRFNLSD